ncbi:Arylsulfatase [Sphingobacterium multivorum]|nr:Arylsulfatase [Sphingobacterium multivorum]VXD01868.1 Arylsulfatase [Sphingobacterium multivorum]
MGIVNCQTIPFKQNSTYMKKPLSLALLLSASLFVTLPTVSFAQKASKPNVIYIYADDLGFGDLSSYGAKQIETPNLDKLARNGVRFTNAHSTSATCTPSRFALMTGTYPWRQEGTGILPGDAKLIVPTDKITLPKVFKHAGYATAIVGKWHMGLGN